MNYLGNIQFNNVLYINLLSLNSSNLQHSNEESEKQYFLILEMMERPYYMDYSPARLVIHKMVTSKYFDLAISAVIGLNVITMAMEFYMMPVVRFCLSLLYFYLVSTVHRSWSLHWRSSTISSLEYSSLKQAWKYLHLVFKDISLTGIIIII